MNPVTATPIWKVWGDALDRALQGIAWIDSGCAPTAGVGLAVSVASGGFVVNSGTAVTTYAGGSVTPTAADGTNPRRDIVFFSNAGTLTVTAGTPAANPLPPALPAGNALVAVLFIPAGATDYSAGFPTGGIADYRVIRGVTFGPGNTSIATLKFSPDATYDIGATGATRPRDLFLSRNAVIGGTAAVAGVQTNSARFHQAKGVDIASGSALTPGTDGNYFHVTGTITITSIATAQAGSLISLEFDGACQLTHNGTSLILIGAANYTTTAGDVLTFRSEGSGNWREISRGPVAGYGVSLDTVTPAAVAYTGAAGSNTKASKSDHAHAVALTKLTNSLSGNVAITTGSTYYDGPSVAQGTTGVWFASGTVQLTMSGSSSVSAKLWDGTNVIASANATIVSGSNGCISLSGYITNPAGNIRISVTALNSSVATILAAMPDNSAGNNASTISVFRIG